MAHTLTLLLVHVVFSTKERRPWLDNAVRADMHAYLGGIAREAGAMALAGGPPRVETVGLEPYDPRLLPLAGAPGPGR